MGWGGVGGIKGPLHLLISFTQKKSRFSRISLSRDMRNSKQGTPCSQGPTIPQKQGVAYHLPGLFHFRGMVPRSLEKTVLGYKTDKRLLKRFTSQRDRETIYNQKFSRVNALRKGRGGTSVVRTFGFGEGHSEKGDRGQGAGRHPSEVQSNSRKHQGHLSQQI